jgi:hypothetical protein
MDELKLELQNRAISRAAVGMSTTAQVAAVASALCWPVGLWVGGWLGVAALASAAVLVMGGTVAAIDEEIKAIEGGDKRKLKAWLTEDDLTDAMTRHGLGGTPEPPKMAGTSSPNPSPSTETQTAPTAAPESAAGAPADITTIIHQHLSAPVVAVVGPQGVGKSTFLHWLYGQIPGAAIALDPHAAKGDHAGLVVVGAGMDYEAIEGAVTQIRELVEERYRARAQGVTEFPHLLVVVEELTNWADKVSSAKALIKEALSDFRKANVQLVLVAHGKTNALMGGSDGMAALRQSGMLLLDIAEKGKGTLTIPGDQRRSLAVSIPLLQPQPIERPPLPFRLGEGAIVTPPPATTPQAKVMRHLENCPDGLSQGVLIQKVTDLKAMGKEAAQQVLNRMVMEGQIRAETTEQSIRYYPA